MAQTAGDGPRGGHVHLLRHRAPIGPVFLRRQRTAVIPNLSVAVAVLLGIVTILAIVAFINHSAHAMDVSEILERVRRVLAPVTFDASCHWPIPTAETPLPRRRSRRLDLVETRLEAVARAPLVEEAGRFTRRGTRVREPR
ncbi:MAG: DUF2254 family protein [Acidimicrobiales bacterium]